MIEVDQVSGQSVGLYRHDEPGGDQGVEESSDGWFGGVDVVDGSSDGFRDGDAGAVGVVEEVAGAAASAGRGFEVFDQRVQLTPQQFGAAEVIVALGLDKTLVHGLRADAAEMKPTHPPLAFWRLPDRLPLFRPEYRL